MELLFGFIQFAAQVLYNVGVFLLGYGAYKYLSAPRKSRKGK